MNISFTHCCVVIVAVPLYYMGLSAAHPWLELIVAQNPCQSCLELLPKESASMLPHLHLTTVSTVMGAQLHGWIIKNFWL
jgi:hypothetical protein